MGLPDLWKIIQDQDRSIPIAQLATEHYKTHGRPLRVAVDEADWRFHNLTVPQVFAIREKSNQPAFQGIEKAIFYRICRFLTLNIQLLFVFDGPSRPWKRGRPVGRPDYERFRLIKELLQAFGIPYHEAPGEAEAECARLQQLGVVDAVFSQDSDSLMFGCDFLIRDDRVAKQAGVTDRSKENTRKDAKSIRVVRASEIREAHGLDRDGLVLFAMLKGGDYDTKGLPGCGEAATMRAVKAGLGRSLCNCRTKADCMAWRENLVSFFSRSRSIVVPPNFPEIKTLNKYNKPTVSTDEELLNLRGLRGGWDRPIKELKLLEVTSSRFNIWGRLYLNWIAPILLTRYLTTNDPLVNAGNPHMIKLMKSRVKEDETPLERKLTFSPFGLTTLRRGDLEGGERQGYWDGARDVPFDPNHRVQCEIADYFLQKALPKEIMSPPMASRKRQRQDEDQPESSTSDRTRRHERRVDATPSASAKRANSGSRAHIIDLVGYDPECDSDSDKDILTPLNFGSFIGPQDRRVRQISDRHHVHSISTSVSGGSASILIEDDDEGDSAFQEAIRRSMEDVTPCGKSSAGADRVNGQLSHLLSVRSNRAGCSPAARKPKISSANTPTTPILSQPSPLRGYSNVSDSSGPQKDKGIVPSLCGLGSQETKDNENLQRGSSSLADTPSRKAHIRNLDNLDSAGITATPRSIEEIREARVRRFTKQTSTTCEQISVEASTMQGPASTVRESAAIECIDLTSD